MSYLLSLTIYLPDKRRYEAVSYPSGMWVRNVFKSVTSHKTCQPNVGLNFKTFLKFFPQYRYVFPKKGTMFPE